jgi:hypothetical protein
MSTDLAAQVARLTAERDGWIRSFDRLGAAINHHERDKFAAPWWIAEPDERLWAARTRIAAAAPDAGPAAAGQAHEATFSARETGIGIEAGYGSDVALIAAAEAERAGLPPVVRDSMDSIDREAARKFTEGERP